MLLADEISVRGHGVAVQAFCAGHGADALRTVGIAKVKGGGMALSGAGFVDRNRHEPTADGPQDGRWLAIDESGWDGEQLHGRERQYLTIAVVAVDDVTAAGLVRDLRSAAKLPEGTELKFRQFRSGRRSETLRDLFSDGGALAERCLVAVADKEYCAVAKMIDLLVEEQDHAEGGELLFTGGARDMARTLYALGPRALGQDRFDRLVDAFVQLASARGRTDPVTAADRLFQEIEEAWPNSYRRPVTDVLMRLRTTLQYADAIHTDGNDMMPALEMLIPALVQLIRWGRHFGAISVLVDEQKVFTDDTVAGLEQELRSPGPVARKLRQPRVDLRALLRGNSATHPSIQLGDMLAGAAGIVVNTPRGADAHADVLRETVLGVLDPHSLLPPGDFSSIFG